MAYRCRYDREWTMEFVSDGCEALIGCPANYLQGKKGVALNDFIHPEDQQHVWDEIAIAVTQRQSFGVNYQRMVTALTWMVHGVGCGIKGTVWSGREMVCR